MTEYTVFEFEKSEPEVAGAWKIMVTVEARSAHSAIRKYLSEYADNGKEGQFAAVPHRSWNPVTVKVETKTALRFST